MEVDEPRDGWWVVGWVGSNGMGWWDMGWSGGTWDAVVGQGVGRWVIGWWDIGWGGGT